MNLLEVQNLVTEFKLPAGALRAVDGVSFALKRKEILGIAGESGSGKTVTALSLLRLVDAPGRIVGGRVLYFPDGSPEKNSQPVPSCVDLLALSQEEIREVRGNKIAMIFQEPMTSLNPVFTIGNQI